MITPSDARRMRQARHDGCTFAQIYRMFDQYTKAAIYKYLNPEGYAHRQRKMKEYRQRNFDDRVKHMRPADRVTQDKFRAMKATIPDDTRSLTGRLLGDPLPTRSALEKRILGHEY